jgi:glycosyltransferase involved in cell wall biosynthesis
MVKELGLSGRVLFPGPLYGDNKVAALTDADVFVLPSLYESFGVAAAEAMACGTPVIVTDGCGIAPFVRDQAGLVVPHSTEALRDALQCLLTDSNLYQRFKAQGPVVAQGLSWDEPVTQMEALYGQLNVRTFQPGD